MPTVTRETFATRINLAALKADLVVTIPVTVSAAYPVVSQGNLLGLITATGKYRRRTRAIVGTGGVVTSAAVFNVADASMFIPGDVLTSDSGSAVGTIASNGVNTSVTPNTITLTANASNAVAANAGVIGSDGSQVALGFADYWAGIDDFNVTLVSVDTITPMVIGGYLNEGVLIGLDSTAITQLAGISLASLGPAGIFKF